MYLRLSIPLPVDQLDYLTILMHVAGFSPSADLDPRRNFQYQGHVKDQATEHTLQQFLTLAIVSTVLIRHGVKMHLVISVEERKRLAFVFIKHQVPWDFTEVTVLDQCSGFLLGY